MGLVGCENRLSCETRAYARSIAGTIHYTLAQRGSSVAEGDQHSHSDLSAYAGVFVCRVVPTHAEYKRHGRATIA